MAYPFPSEAWLKALEEVLNSDSQYAQVAQDWEGDMVVVIEPEGEEGEENLPMIFYLDLWHGRCREARMIGAGEDIPEAAYTLRAHLDQILRIFHGELDPMQAMLTRKLRVEGNMGYMLKNVPTVLDFVRCCRKVEIEA